MHISRLIYSNSSNFGEIGLCNEQNDINIIYKNIPNEIIVKVIKSAGKKQWKKVELLLFKYSCHKEVRINEK